LKGNLIEWSSFKFIPPNNNRSSFIFISPKNRDYHLRWAMRFLPDGKRLADYPKYGVYNY